MKELNKDVKYKIKNIGIVGVEKKNSSMIKQTQLLNQSSEATVNRRCVIK